MNRLRELSNNRALSRTAGVLALVVALATGSCGNVSAYPHEEKTCIQPDGDTGGCYGSSNLGPFVTKSFGDVMLFADESGISSPKPHLEYIDQDRKYTSDSDGCKPTVDTQSFTYCREDQTLYIGSQVTEEDYTQNGAADVEAGIAHEYGHHLQEIGRATLLLNANPVTASENQADCVSGAFYVWGKEKGLFSAQDDDDVRKGIAWVADPEPGGLHGTQEERQHWFDVGVAAGLPGCGVIG